MGIFHPTFSELEQQCNLNAVYRAQDWQKVLNDNRDGNEWVKLNRIKHFFNKEIAYQDDLPLWGKKGYWASPFETIGRSKGDCEDYAIAKFSRLLRLVFLKTS
ncbi:transglutaminase-like cysteine peptidase [Psychrobium sp. 1_MG-2023]|uniref:transglutaminase-like cysteine peptidase n=1 Tax=Psychrobium sp. 1_MG-2023 TaxID=3062624 RepID=UPI000C31F7E2|nr:transglutaminase-like cysteine peptidase [Psychrobium sp. 1_MG-2023]MDP2560339.1 transglutaminase-like cysteine peptidase [Psychrobium sp. 1_MG-2023]PKF55449.1 hypothetical protein CW748_13210 [Alteromonadales bacterium alter-6D02]